MLIVFISFSDVIETKEHPTNTAPELHRKEVIKVIS